MIQVDVVIPSKSNLAGLAYLIDHLKKETHIRTIYVILDGPQLADKIDNSGISLTVVPEGSGIHVMWNIALNNSDGKAHMLFLNDDVTLCKDTITGMAETLAAHPELGLVCPTYAPETFDGDYREVTEICGGRYDGTGGLAGFCMTLRNTLIHEWRFDERMKWWFGDNDILLWVRLTKQKIVAICSNAHCSDNDSWTINNDPPKNFLQEVKQDQIIFEEKWKNAS
jgi:hypothetical protein